MPPGDRFTVIRNSMNASKTRAQQMVQRGDYAGAENLYKDALKQWRFAQAPRDEEAPLILALGKCYEAQRKYETAYELYMEALNYLTGTAYDDVYSSFLYLNERMGTFVKRDPSGF